MENEARSGQLSLDACANCGDFAPDYGVYITYGEVIALLKSGVLAGTVRGTPCEKAQALAGMLDELRGVAAD
jgi:hypothetical protein